MRRITEAVWREAFGVRRTLFILTGVVGLASCGPQATQDVSGDKSLKADPASGFPAMTVEDVVQANALYIRHCASCHDNPQGQVPSRQTLTGLTAQRIYDALSTGPMQAQGAALSEQEKRVLAASLPAGEPLPEPKLTANICADHTVSMSSEAGDWHAWSPDIGNTRYQPTGGLDVGNVPRLKLRWAFAYPGGVGGLPLVAHVSVVRTFGTTRGVD